MTTESIYLINRSPVVYIAGRRLTPTRAHTPLIIRVRDVQLRRAQVFSVTGLQTNGQPKAV